jgi:hypothetical protein
MHSYDRYLIYVMFLGGRIRDTELRVGAGEGQLSMITQEKVAAKATMGLRDIPTAECR